MSISLDEVKKLAEMSRIELSSEEMTKMQGEIDAILAYIETIKKVEMPDGVAPSPHLALENVMREDGEPHKAGVFTEELLSQAPKRNGDFIEVKKILGE